MSSKNKQKSWGKTNPRHGGEDPGAVSGSLYEKDLTLKISNYMYDKFKSLGIPVKLTRSKDVALSPKERVKKILSFYGNSKDVIVISNHINAGGKGEGAEVIYALRNKSTYADDILSYLKLEGQKIRGAYQKRSTTNAKKDYYFILRDTANCESVIVEYGFITNKSDQEKLSKNYKKYADAVVKATLKYKGLEKKDTFYTVKKGDTLYSIAKKYNMKVDELKNKNKLKSNLIHIGDKLLIKKA